MRENGGRTVLMDFGTGGIMKRLSPAGSGDDFAGTPLYLPPKCSPDTRGHASLGNLQPWRAPVFPRDRTYPVEGDSRTEIGGPARAARIAASRCATSGPDLPDGFIRVVERASAEAPEERYQSAGELEAALAQVLSPPSARPSRSPLRARAADWKKALIFAALVVLAVGLAAMTTPAICCRDRQ